MPLVYNVPLLTILLFLICAILLPLIHHHERFARWTIIIAASLSIIATAYLLFTLWIDPQSIVYSVGHFPAPWGNELRFGIFEVLMALVFLAILLLSITGSCSETAYFLTERRISLYYSLLCLMAASMLALIYTNDLFTSYVFIEVNTLVSCAVVMAKNQGDTLLAAMRYLFMSLLGSGLYLLAVSILYSITGHLLMANIYDAIQNLADNHLYIFPLVISCGFMTVALSLKSALFPFHTWLPNAHSCTTSTSSAVLSALVIKGYLILLIKLYYRVFSIDIIRSLGICNVLFVLGIISMIAGSVMAFRQKSIKRMLAYSSISQAGYIFMGIGLATQAGLFAAVYHIITHAAAKAALFLIAGFLIREADSQNLFALRDAGKRMPITMALFSICALSLIGIPGFMGFTSKWYFAMALIQYGSVTGIIALTLSTLLTALCYLPLIIRVFIRSYAPSETSPLSLQDYRDPRISELLPTIFSCIALIAFGLSSKMLSQLILLGVSQL